MKRILKIIGISREERVPVFSALAFIMVLNAMIVYHFRYTWGDLNVDWEISGFDNWVYVQLVRPHLTPLFRHPFMNFMLWPFGMLNESFISLTGRNAAILITGSMTTVCSLYSFLFLFRILRNYVGISVKQTMVLCFFFMSMGFVMLTMMVPDSFVFSMFCILLTLLIAGNQIMHKRMMSVWITIILFLFTAGVTLSNGLKVFIVALFTRGKEFFRWKYLVAAVMLPFMFIVCFAWCEEEMAYKIIDKQCMYEDSMQVVAMVKDLQKKNEIEGKKYNNVVDSIWNVRKAKRVTIKDRDLASQKHHHPDYIKINMNNTLVSNVLVWTNNRDSRFDALTENVFGEGIQLHRDYSLLNAEQGKRPVVVKYTGVFRFINYTVEICIFVLFMLGLCVGRKSKFMQMVAACVFVDILIHLVAGFGLLEVYIYSGHWIFIIPIAVGYLIKKYKYTIIPVAVVTLWLMIWNISVIGKFFLC